MSELSHLTSEVKTFLSLLEANGGTLGGYTMCEQYIKLQQAIKKAEAKLDA